MQTNERKDVNSQEESELLKEYREQTQKEGKHDVHIDGYYSDYSESSCCC